MHASLLELNFLYVSQHTAKMATLIAPFTSLTVSTTIIKTLSANTARKLVTSVRKVISLFSYYEIRYYLSFLLLALPFQGRSAVKTSL